jgi:hypothetical protein
MELLRTIEWWQKRATAVLAELVQPGLVRLYSAKEATPLVGTVARKFASRSVDAHVRFESLQALADRYRQLKLYSDGRVRFTKEVASILEFNLGEKPTLYMQPFGKGLEVMSLSFRERRLLDLIDTTTIGLHLN